MRVIIKILVFCLLSTFSYSQNDIFSDFSVNKYYFSDEDDTLTFGIKINSEFINSNHLNPEENISIVLKPISKNTGSDGGMQITKFLNLIDSSELYQFYGVSICVKEMQQSRYMPDILIKGEKINLKLSDLYSQIDPISIGPIGIFFADIEMNLNGIKTEYQLIGNDVLKKLPDSFEGIFTKGFCSDEFLQISGIKIASWVGNTFSDLSIKMRYKIDGIPDQLIDITEISDDSKDGTLIFGNDSCIYNFYSEDIVSDYSFKIDNPTDNLLDLIENNESGEHAFNICFEIISGGYSIRYPSKDFYSFNFKVVEDPIGPDCQAALLPIDLLDWQVFKKEKTVYLNWETSTEVDNDFFEIERSNDASNWQSIKKIKGKGNSNQHSKYQETDNFPLLGINYYRLKQTDFNGENKFSRVRSITNIENSLIFWPNPVADFLNYEVLDDKRQFSIELLDSSGRIVRSYIVPDKYSKQNTLDLTNLKSGIYIFKYINLSNNQFNITKLVKL